MEALTQRVEQLEKTTQHIQQDVAVLTARSESFATKADIECLRTEQGVLRIELLGEIHQLEKRMDVKFERMDETIETKFEKIDEKFEKIEEKFDRKFDKLNERLTWSIMVPALTAVLAWFIKVAILQV